MKRWLIDTVKDSWPKCFHLAQRLGVDVLPRHFYSEIPDIARLKATQDWRRPYTFIGVNGLDVDEELRFVRSTITPELVQRLARGDIYQSACERNGAVGYGPVEADFLYAFIATHQPHRILQVGCGVSTAICLEAARESGFLPRIVCVDPYPTDFLKRTSGRGEITLIAEPIEAQDYTIVSDLGAGDLLFIDSTHTLGPAGEVGRIILELLPRLESGVYVHFHDITFPYDYGPHVLSKALFFWHESIVLHAFLANNPRFTILASMSMLHYERASELATLLPNYRPCANRDGLADGEGHFPSSIYLKVKG